MDGRNDPRENKNNPRQSIREPSAPDGHHDWLLKARDITLIGPKIPIGLGQAPASLNGINCEAKADETAN